MSRRRRSSRAHPGEARSTPPEPTQIIEIVEEIEIDSLAAGGDGVGRAADGRVVFARLTAPGDRVRITAPDAGARYLKASAVELLEPGPKRVEPICKVFGQCGGCAWQHIAYPLQIEAKRRILSDAIERIGKFAEPPPIEFIPSPAAYGYRGRTRLLSASGRIGFRRFRDHEIEPITNCPVLIPELDFELGILASKLAAVEFDPASSPREVEWELAAGSDNRVLASELSEKDDVVGPTEHSVASPIEIEVAGERIRISPGGFAQANPSLYESLYSIVFEALEGISPGLLLELFAGAGFFTVGLARRFERVVAVESDPRAILDLEHNLELAGRAGVDVHAARVENALEKLAPLRPDLILLDPPRTGLARGAAERLAALEAPRIAYLSCDPATLARDLKILCNDPLTGNPRYRLTRLTGVDLFPQTPHVEALAILDRTPPNTNRLPSLQTS